IDAYVHLCAFCKHSELVHIGNAAEIEQRLSMYGCRVCGLITPGPYGEETIQFDLNNSKGGDDDN
ncbi:MAG TPA: hypothetical protein D7H89_01685, partial [Candidatus Poseidoniales archaeon]